MHRFHDNVPVNWLDVVAESAVSDIERIEDLGTREGDDLVYTIHLAQIGSLPERHRTRVRVNP